MQEAESLAPLRENPERTGLFFDVDGTLAPIVERPGDAAVPKRARELLGRLAGEYALVACISGRRAMDARRVVGLDELVYSGNHGFELLLPGEDEPRPDPSLDGHDEDAARFVDALDQAQLQKAGIRKEDKGAIIALHWRGAENEGAAESLAHEIASDAEWQELVAHRGRKVLEIRPNVAVNKGIAVAAVVPMRPIDAALYAGDDRTDVDAFQGLRALQADGELSTVLCVAVSSEETPPEVQANADFTVAGPEGVVALLEELAG